MSSSYMKYPVEVVSRIHILTNQLNQLFTQYLIIHITDLLNSNGGDDCIQRI